jgi:acetyltransferase-like isoleucine patch superfamily enzyme
LRYSGLSVEREVRIAAGARFYGNRIALGEGSWIGPETSLISTATHTIRIGRNVDIGPGCLITAGTHEIGDERRRAGIGRGIDVQVGDGTWIGARCTILPGVMIGKASVVAAGAVVLAGGYPDHAFLAGVPAAIKKTLDGSGTENACSGHAQAVGGDAR